MTTSPVSALNATCEKTHMWLTHLTTEGHFVDDLQAYSAFRAVMHALRDRLRVEEAVHVAAQFPMLIRGMYYEGWEPAAAPACEPTLESFFEHVRDNFALGSGVDAHEATRAVFRLLDEKISLGEIQNIRQVLPPELHSLWPNGNACSP